MEENKTNENQTENRNQEIFGSNEPKKEESFTMKKATLWKISTLVFAILLAVSWYTGGSNFDGGNEITGGTVINTGDQPSLVEDWSIFENDIPSSIKSKISDFTTENPVNSAEGISEFKSYDLIPNTLIVFYEPECGWCKRYYPVLIEAEKKYPEIDIYVPRLTENRDIASKYGITGTPSNVINGKYAVGGYMPLEGLSEVLDSLN